MQQDHGRGPQIGEKTRTDPRVTRTRALLIDAVLTLLKDTARSSSTLSISEITALAGLSRPTFYQHYSDPEQLIADAVRQQLQDRIESGLASDDSADPFGNAATPPTLLELLTEINRHRWLYTPLVNGGGQFGQGRQEIVERLADYFATLDLDQDTCRFAAGGMVSVIAPWMQHPDPDTDTEVEAIAGRLWTLIRRTVRD